MFVPTPIDRNFVPSSNRRVLRRQAGIIIDATGDKDSGGMSRVVPQYTPCGPGSDCGTPCGPGAVCDGPWGDCKPRHSVRCP
jgi:hypothetical protein